MGANEQGLSNGEFMMFRVIFMSTIRENQFGGFSEVVCARPTRIFHHPAGKRADGLKRQLPRTVGFDKRHDAEARVQVGAAARETGFQQRQHIAPLAAFVTAQWILLGALEHWIDDEHLIGLAQSDGLRR